MKTIVRGDYEKSRAGTGLGGGEQGGCYANVDSHFPRETKTIGIFVLQRDVTH